MYRDVPDRVAPNFGEPLTETEYQVWLLCLEGLTGKQISVEVGCGTRSVESHIYTILRKLGYRDRLSMLADYLGQAANVILEEAA
jgi:DNA-binding NarL/FixJ family response regulator